jgi:hypothetical protein
MNYNMQMKYMFDDYESSNKIRDFEIKEMWQIQQIRSDPATLRDVGEGVRDCDESSINAPNIQPVQPSIVTLQDTLNTESVNTEDMRSMVESLCRDVLNEIILQISEETKLLRLPSPDRSNHDEYPDINPYSDDYPPEWPIDYITHQDNW